MLIQGSYVSGTSKHTFTRIFVKKILTLLKEIKNPSSATVLYKIFGAETTKILWISCCVETL